MSYLLDTNILSEHSRRRPDARLTAWLTSQPPDSLWISVVTVGEIERGIARLGSREPDRAKRLASWIEATVTQFQDRIIPMDRDIARRWGRMTAATPGLDIDAIIAATAAVRGLTVVTRNVRDLERFGVPVLNPFAPSA
ncbi:type II toxin-antitoxin system VapC family toxin [Inquilinus limosus]|uniref:type II toxin-antitoxin system VapC family toxin n=1 Tax=Inquilinus limosus TaxID=171674 RepID=UPI0003FB5B31|nr:type II toxin-antitoxin system VapC family toxin [Inquilinus limosus]